MNRALVAAFAVCALFVPSLAEECQTDSDCIIASEQTTAGVCEEWGPRYKCRNRTAPWPVKFLGDVNAFCRAYVHGCSTASLTMSRNATQVKVTIKGPGTFKERNCELEVALESHSTTSGSAGRIADSVEACVHNAPVYFHKTMASAEQGTAHCCGYSF